MLAQTVIYLSLGAVGLSALGAILAGGDGATRLAADHVPLALAVLASVVLLRRGWTTAASVLVVAAGFAEITWAVYGASGIYGITISLYALVVVVATLLLGRAGGLVTVAASLAAVIGFYWAARTGRMVFDAPNVDLEGRTAVLVTLLVACGALIVTAHHRMWSAVRLALDSEERAQQLAATLEARVAERTAELVARQEELIAQQEERERLEVELHHAHKLEAVGQLAAGIAHEINTPVQYVGDSMHFLEEASADLWRLVELALEEGGSEAVAAEAEELDVGFLREALPEAFARSRAGVDRVTEIVRAMRAFAHSDRGERVPASLDELIETAVIVATNEYKYCADIHFEPGDLPPVPCYPGDLGQVILNLLVNASHAIQERVEGTGQRGTIALCAWSEGPWAVLTVTDDGCGIPADVAKRIFDPFFTTKDVGRGTGQGLAICHHVVVEKHGGRIEVDSTPGVGTTFHVRIPLHPEEAASAA